MKKFKNVFTVLAIFMIGFGIITGVLFPFFIRLMGIGQKMPPIFLLLCILAGILVGAVNFILCVGFIKRRFRKSSSSNSNVENKLQTIMSEDIEQLCNAEEYYINTISGEEFKKCSNAFNQLLSAFEKLLEAQNAVRKYNRMLTSDLSMKVLTKRALKKILNYTKADYGAVYVVKDGNLELTAVEGIKNAEKLANNNHILNAIQTKNTKTIILPQDKTVDELLAEIKPSSIVIEPLIYKDTVLGVMVLASLKQESHNLDHLGMFSGNLALALNKSLKHSQLQTLVAIDPLTGVYNRRFGFVRLEEEYSAAVRSEAPLGLLMLDLDHFKNINDTYGHIAGDKVLAEVSKMIKVMLRKYDLLVRYGGEEFIVVLPGTSTRESMLVANRIRLLIEESNINYANTPIQMTVSIGVVSFPETPISKLEDLIKFADEAMYKSKFAGRNQVTLYDATLIA